jgi:aspartate-semialdehyde dehydrogenase
VREYIVAVAGATGAVGQEMIEVLEEFKIPIKKLVPLASKNSLGKTVQYNGEEIAVQELTESVFKEEGVEIALFSAGGSVSAKYAPYAAEAGAVVIDNTSHFRMQEDVPLVVPEVNKEDIKEWGKTGIIANPNCSTIQMVTALKPLDELFDVERIDIATYQATSGAGMQAMEELVDQMKKFFEFKLDEYKPQKFVHQIALNLIPQIDSFLDTGYTKEEMKMVNETQKIMHKNMEVSATCVRVPVLRGHSEAVTIRCKKPVDAAKAREALSKADGIIVEDEPSKSVYPMPRPVSGKNDTYVGRIRVDNFNPNILHLWIVADNIRVGAATNAVRIAKEWIAMQEVK